MPEISRFFGIIIALFHDEHNPPHFHVRYNEHQAEIGIQALALLAGRLPPRVMGLVWATMHQDERMADWELARQTPNSSALRPWSKTRFLIDVANVRPLENHRLELIFAAGPRTVFLSGHGQAGVGCYPDSYPLLNVKRQ